jgi:hypothetical protein
MLSTQGIDSARMSKFGMTPVAPDPVPKFCDLNISSKFSKSYEKPKRTKSSPALPNADRNEETKKNATKKKDGDNVSNNMIMICHFV